MKQFYFIGAEENENNDTAFNFRHTDEDIKDIYEKVFGNVYQNRFDKLAQIYKDLGYDNVEFVRYPNYGHSGTPGIQHTTEQQKTFSEITEGFSCRGNRNLRDEVV